MLRFVFIFSLVFSLSAQASLSAKREKNQDYREIIAKVLPPTENVTAHNSAAAFDELDAEKVVEWSSMTEMQERFEVLRDERYLQANKGDEFLRRISWLYPDDGCFARAAMFNNLAEEKSFERPDRIFIFGDLTVQTDNHPSGEVGWWYHTAPIVRVDGEVFVLDPAISPKEPMKVEDWILTQVEELSDADYSYCSTYTYGPSDLCEADETADDRADTHQKRFLGLEWSRQQALERDPEAVLGDTPPWLEILQP